MKAKEACARRDVSSKGQIGYSPTPLIGEAVAKASHVVSDGGPFGAANDANVLDGQDGEEQIFVGSVVPILTVHDRRAMLRAAAPETAVV
jgi:hypothetical protein